MAEKTRILIVDDDENIADLIALYMTKECFDTRTASDGEKGLEAFDEYDPHLVILDLMMPGKDGYQVVREIRSRSQTPIILLSAKGEVFDKVLGFEMGANDYVQKPFDSKELVARVKAVLRTYNAGAPAAPAPEAEAAGEEAAVECVTYPDLVINLTNYSVTYYGNRLDIPPKEIELLYFLASAPNRVFNREQLLDHIWGYEYLGGTRTVDVHIKRLREKIKDHEQWRIGTVWGVGYRFETGPATQS